MGACLLEAQLAWKKEPSNCKRAQTLRAMQLHRAQTVPVRLTKRFLQQSRMGSLALRYGASKQPMLEEVSCTS